ncbi:MAG: hypothetical protein U5J63_14510 [Fodinibius sp.]|nr:hypothetical protein [Fodinibius sp.]
MMRPATFTSDIDSITLLKHLAGFVIVLGIILAGTTRVGRNHLSIPGDITIEEGGKVWIDGSAGPVNFRCNAEQLSGAGAIQNTSNPRATVQDDGQISISVQLPVKTPQLRANGPSRRTVYEALKSERFPTIHYKLLDADLG